MPRRAGKRRRRRGPQVNAEGGELLAQAGVIGVNDSVPPTGAGAGDIGRQVVNEQALVRRAVGTPLTMLKKRRRGLAGADSVRKDEGIKAAQGLGKLPAEVPGVQLIGVATQ